jgi:hypothetical protein
MLFILMSHCGKKHMDSPTSSPSLWFMAPGMIGFAIAFVVQFKLKHHVDREKVVNLSDMSELFTNGMPPKKVLTEQGCKYLWWFRIGAGLFVANALLLVLLDP